MTMKIRNHLDMSNDTENADASPEQFDTIPYTGQIGQFWALCPLCSLRLKKGFNRKVRKERKVQFHAVKSMQGWREKLAKNKQSPVR